MGHDKLWSQSLLSRREDKMIGVSSSFLILIYTEYMSKLDQVSVLIA